MKLLLFTAILSLIDVAQQGAFTQSQTASSCSGILDFLYKISMPTIALCNLLFIIMMHRSKRVSDENKEQEERQRRKRELRIDYLKTIVYEQNLPRLYDFFSSLQKELQKLKDRNQNRKEIEKGIQELFKSFRSDFIIILSAAVSKLGDTIQDECDTMRDGFVEKLSDEGINLWVEKYYNDNIKSVFERGKVNIINALFNYDGSEPHISTSENQKKKSCRERVCDYMISLFSSLKEKESSD